MRKLTYGISIAVTSLFIAEFSLAQPKNLITLNTVDNVKLGMTVSHVRDIVAPMILSRTSDGEGVALIAVKEGKKVMMTLYAGEGDPAKKINEQAKIQNIEAWSPRFKTATGIHAGMPLKEVEHQYGKLTTLQRSEIESREYATFENQPHGITIRVSGKKGKNAGQYIEGSNQASSYTDGASVLSISIHNTLHR